MIIAPTLNKFSLTFIIKKKIMTEKSHRTRQLLFLLLPNIFPFLGVGVHVQPILTCQNQILKNEIKHVIIHGFPLHSSFAKSSKIIAKCLAIRVPSLESSLFDDEPALYIIHIVHQSKHTISNSSLHM